MNKKYISQLIAVAIVLCSCSNNRYINNAGNQRNREIINTKDGSTLVEIPSGEFIMGADDGPPKERPSHRVFLRRYFIGKYPVTVAQYRKFVEATGYKTDAERTPAMTDRQPNHDATWRNPNIEQTENDPVVQISWNDAKAYCDWAGLRLPTEAEWEKAARGANGWKYPWGNDWNFSLCNNNENKGNITTPVDQYPKGVSPYGCYEMAGNAWQWCNDWYDDGYYKVSPLKNPRGPKKGLLKIIRGGSWKEDQDNCRTTSRFGMRPDYCHHIYSNIGFRVAK